MGVEKLKWWQGLFKKEEGRKRVNIDSDIEAIIDFCSDVEKDAKELRALLLNFENLHREAHVTRHVASNMNAKTRLTLFEDILERYSSFEDDVEINKERLKIIAKHLLDDTAKAGQKDTVELKKESPLWKFQW